MKKLFYSAVLLLVSLELSGFQAFTGNECITKSEFIYQKDDVPFPSCHASTIIETKEGMLAAWFGGTAERDPDVGIWISSFRNGKWSKPLEAADGVQHKDKRYPCWNPVLYNSGSQIILFYKAGPSPSTWWGEMKISDDNGETWSRAIRLPEDIYGPIKNKPVKLENGELLCPSSTENDGWRLHMEFTSEKAEKWERTGFLNGKDIGAIQPTILLHPGGKLQLLCRSRSSAILTAYSEDNGRTWTDLVSTGLPNPNSGIDAVTLRDGRHILIYNHIQKGRHILNAAISGDGKEWRAAALLENEPAGAEFSYPAVIQTSDGLVHVTYTWNRKLIKHAVIDPSEIKPASPDGRNK